MNGINRKAYLALLAICFIWGTTFLAARIGVKTFPPLLFMGSRHFIAGLLLGTICWLRGSRLPSLAGLKRQLLPGILMVTLGNGIVGLAVKYIPSGLAALICAMMPVYVVVINLVSGKGEKINYKIIIGLVSGLAGLLVIFHDKLAFLGDLRYLGGIITCLVSCLFWALGSIYYKRIRDVKEDVYMNAGVQLAIGGMGLITLSALGEDWKGIHGIPPATLGAICYLIVVGSIVAFVCYHYALSRLPVGVVTLYAYINPLVAIILGYLVLNEPVNGYIALAFIFILAGVFLVNAGYRQASLKTKPSSSINKRVSYE